MGLNVPTAGLLIAAHCHLFFISHISFRSRFSKPISGYYFDFKNPVAKGWDSSWALACEGGQDLLCNGTFPTSGRGSCCLPSPTRRVRAVTSVGSLLAHQIPQMNNVQASQQGWAQQDKFRTTAYILCQILSTLTIRVSTKGIFSAGIEYFSRLGTLYLKANVIAQELPRRKWVRSTLVILRLWNVL